jgi:hypothetical protein
MAAGPHLLGHHQGQIAGATAEIQQLLAGLGVEPEDRLALPEAMQPQAQQVVEQVVSGGDGLTAAARRLDRRA